MRKSYNPTPRMDARAGCANARPTRQQVRAHIVCAAHKPLNTLKLEPVATLIVPRPLICAHGDCTSPATGVYYTQEQDDGEVRSQVQE